MMALWTMTVWQRKTFTWLALPALLGAYVVGSEIFYANSISPKGVSNIKDYFHHFGEPHRIRVVQRNGRDYYEFTGHRPSVWLAAFPSEPPAYIFAENGNLAAWCSDPGENTGYRRTWPLLRTNWVEATVIRKRFDL
jgi:hypothetical protein